MTDAIDATETTTTSWVGSVASEIDQRVIAIHTRVSTLLATESTFPNAHPAILQGIGVQLRNGPISMDALVANYPYLPESLRDLLIQNNVDEGIVTFDGSLLTLCEAARPCVAFIADGFNTIADELWAREEALDVVERCARATVTHAQSLERLLEPSAFAVHESVIDQPTQAGRTFRLMNAIRYWRADAHRSAWSDAGLGAAAAHA